MNFEESKRALNSELSSFQNDMIAMVVAFHTKIIDSNYDDELKANIIVGSASSSIQAMSSILGYVGSKYFSKDEISGELDELMRYMVKSFNNGAAKQLQDSALINNNRSREGNNLLQLSDEEIEASNPSGYTLQICDVIIYKTNSEHYGKLKILDFDDNENKKLTIQAISYNDDGSIFNQTDNLEIRGTWTCDLDAMLESGPEVDFHWQRVNGTDTNLSPRGNARFAVY